jgi:MFS family permease
MTSLIPLYVTTFILQAGNGLLITLITVRASREGFSPSLIGFIGTAYFIGFLFGALLATRLIRMVGHIRVFAALAAIVAAGTLGLLLHVEPYTWMALRFVMGFCSSGLFTTIESWLNGAAANEDRGRVLSIYGLVDLVSVTGSQLLLPVLGADGFTSLTVSAMLFTLSLVPIAITPTTEPPERRVVNARFWQVWQISPLAFVGCFVVGLTNGAFRTVGPLYASDIGLGIAGVAVFMSCGIVGGALLQMPLGWLSDRWDRRSVILLATAGASLAGLVLSFVKGDTPYLVYGCALLFGAFAMPLYSLSSANANDFAKPGEHSAVSAGLLFTFAIGAALGPAIASLAMERFGPPALFTYIAIAHASLIAWALVRMRVRPVVPRQDRAKYRPEIRTAPVPADYDAAEPKPVRPTSTG